MPRLPALVVLALLSTAAVLPAQSSTARPVATQRGSVQITRAMMLVLEKSANGWLLLNEPYSIKMSD